MTDINIEAKPVEPIHVTLVGKPYEIHPPKTALAMRMAVEAKSFNDDPEKMVTIMNDWIVRAFGEKQAKAIQKRMEDENDDLDFPHIMALIEAVIEKQTANPTS